MYKKVHLRRIVVMLLVCMTLAACQTPQPTPVPPSPAPTQAVKPTVSLPTAAATSAPAPTSAPTTAPVPTPTTAPTKPAQLQKVKVSYSAQTAFQSLMWLAKDKGLFEKYGLDAEVTQISSVQQVGAMQAGQIDFGFTSADNVVSAILSGADLVELSLFVPYIEAQFWCRPEIKTAQDLRGKVAGTSTIGPGINRHSIEYSLQKLGLVPGKDMELRVFRTTTDAFAAAMGGQIQCVALFPPEQLQAERINFNMLYDVSKDRVLYPSGSSYTSRKMIREHPDWVIAFLKAISEGIAVYKTDPDFAVNTYQKWTKLEDRVAIKSGWDFFQRDIPNIPKWSPDAMKMTLAALAAELEKAKTVDPTSLYDNSFIEQLEKEGFYAQLEKQYPRK